MTSRSPWAGIPTLVVAWVAFGQVLSLSGLAIWVVGGSLLAFLSTSALASAGRRGLAFGAAVVLTVAVPALAQLVGGDSAGPITRSSLMAAGVAAAMGVILQTRYPVALLAAGLILLGGATGLGAAGRAPWLVGAWVVAAGTTVAMLGPYTRADLAARRRLVPLALVLAGAGLAAVAMVASATPVLRSPWTIPGAADVGEPSVEPTPTVSPTLPPTTEPTVQPTVAPSQEVDPVEDDVVDVTDAARLVLVLLLGLLLVLVVLRLLWQLTIWLWWRGYRRRLRGGDPVARVAGAWTWVRVRSARYGHPLPVSASPDVAADHAPASSPLHTVASRAARVAFDPSSPVTPGDADRAWVAADDLGRPPAGSGPRQRWRWGRRTPRQVRSALPQPLVRPHGAPAGERSA